MENKNSINFDNINKMDIIIISDLIIKKYLLDDFNFKFIEYINKKVNEKINSCDVKMKEIKTK